MISGDSAGGTPLGVCEGYQRYGEDAAVARFALRLTAENAGARTAALAGFAGTAAADPVFAWAFAFSLALAFSLAVAFGGCFGALGAGAADSEGGVAGAAL